MDTRGFRIGSKNTNPSRWSVFEQAQKESSGNGVSMPADDSRYPAYAGIMSDARTFTDYRSRCATRVSPPYTQPVKEWMIENAEQIMDLTRKRQTENTGANFGTANTVPPPETVQFCDPFGCEMDKTNAVLGTGLVNVNECPELPGTFIYGVSPEGKAANVKNTIYNLVNENGRNSNKRWENYLE
jgi:hypothetical protein